MTTATKPTTSVTAKLEQLEEAKAKAQSEARQGKLAVEGWDSDTREQRIALSVRLGTHPDEFDGGRARPGTEAATLEAAIKERMHGVNPCDADHQQATVRFHEADAKLEALLPSRRFASLPPHL